MTSAAKHLPPTDVWCILYPSLRHFLTADIHTVDERSLLTMLKPPVSEGIYIICFILIQT
jgi:phosphoinositide-3-kinase, regulatory subunit 4